MDSFFGLLLMAASVLITVISLTIWIKRKRNRQQEKKLETVSEDPPSSVYMWFTAWLAERRGLSQVLITSDVPVSPEEVKAGLRDAIETFDCPTLLRSTDIETVGEFVGMIERQLEHRGKRKKIASRG